MELATMNRDANTIREERRKLREEFGALYDRLAALLFEHDPIGINYEQNTDEYEPEVGTILPRLKTCRSADDVQRVVHEEFCRWFDLDAGPLEAYEGITLEIWSLITKAAGPQR